MDKKLPKDWKIVELKDVVSILGDGLHGTPKYSNESEYFFINGNNLVNGKIKIKENTKKVSFEEYEKYKKPLNNSSLLISINGTIGNQAFYNNEKVILGKSACYFNVLDCIDKKYISLLLSGKEFLNYAHKNATGSTIPNVSLKTMREFKFPLPPIEAQQAIVSKIEELFSELDKGIEDLKTAQQQLKTYRQSVLKWAFEGKLTNVNVKDGELPKGWSMAKMSTIIKLSSLKHKPEIVENLFYIGLEHIEKHTGKLTSSVGIEKITTIKNKFSVGDILYGKLRPNLNKVYLSKEEGVCSTDILVLKLEEKCIAKYLHQIMISRPFVNEMSENTSGVNLPRVSTKFIMNYEVPLPPVEEQHLIVQEIESRLSVADKMEESITQSLQQAEALRQSILKKAFSGELV